MMITDKSSIQQIFGSLMQSPQLLGRVDKYNLTLNDFSSYFEKYIFFAISELYKQGAKTIEPIDVSNLLEDDASIKKIFDQNNGVEYLQDVKDFSAVDNFDYYYNRLKKINLLRDLKKQGFDISDFYEEDSTNPRAIEINTKFEALTVKDICDGIKNKIVGLESSYVQTGEIEIKKASNGISNLITRLDSTMSIGLSLQGHIYNKVFSGAERGALYIRSGSSGLGKTRAAMGDACYLAYPIRYNSIKGEWEQRGNNEKVLFVVTEQTIEQVQKMILAYLSDISDSRFKLGNFTKDESDRLAKAEQIMNTYDNINFLKMPNPTIETLKTFVREQCLIHNISYVFYDYIFIGPSLLNEFRGFTLRNDELLLMFATALKDLAVELNVAMFTSTQVNASADDNKNIRNEASLAGGRSTINKADNGAIMMRPTNEELESMQDLVTKYGQPNVVTDIFKARSGEWTQVRIWSLFNLGTLKRRDLFITDSRLEIIEGFFESDCYEVHNWEDGEIQEIMHHVNELNKKEQ